MWDQDFETMIRQAAPVLADRPIAPDDDLRALGMDSVATMAFVVELEDHYGIALPLDELVPENFRTPETIWSLVSARRPAVSS